MDQPNRDEDLIDFQLVECSHDVNANSSTHSHQQTACTSPLIISDDNVSEHLLDFELPVLEETLFQSSTPRATSNWQNRGPNSKTPESTTRNQQVDIDQVLITINDPMAEASNCRGLKRKESNSSSFRKKSSRNNIDMQVFDNPTIGYEESHSNSQLGLEKRNSEPNRTNTSNTSGLDIFGAETLPNCAMELDPLYDGSQAVDCDQHNNFLSLTTYNPPEEIFSDTNLTTKYDIQRRDSDGASKIDTNEKPLNFQLGPQTGTQSLISGRSKSQRRFPESMPYSATLKDALLQNSSRQRSSSESQREDQENAFHQDGTLCKSLSCDNMAALGVLMKLDELLDEELKNSGTKCNCTEVEECLFELDNYLKEFDDSSSDDENLEGGTEKRQEVYQGDPVTQAAGAADDFTADAFAVSDKSRFVSRTGSAMLVQAGSSCGGHPETTEDFAAGEQQFRARGSLVGRSASVTKCNERNGDRLVRRHPYRATVGPPPQRIRERAIAALGRCEAHRSTVACRRDRPRSANAAQPLQALVKTTTHQLQLPAAPPAGRTSASATAAARGAESDEDIDWSWMQDVDRDVESPARPTMNTREPELVLERAGTTSPKPNSDGSTQQPSNTRTGSSWLRTSMRRIRHIRLPSDTTSGAATLPAVVTSHPVGVADTLTPPGQAMLAPATGAIHQQLQQQHLGSMRPVSAPSRLPAPPANAGTGSSASAVRVDSGRARSRSRDSRVSGAPGGRARSSSASSRSRRARSLSSSESSLASSVDSAPSAHGGANGEATNATGDGPVVNGSVANGAVNRRTCDRSRENEVPAAQSPLGQWPHGFSSMFACLGCTLGLFNISRFALLSVHFGANFMLQFLILSLLIGMPLFTLQLCLGQQLAAGVIDMWRISPLFQGVGVALLVAQALTGLYSIIGVSWMFIYFRDSFITKLDRYRWAEPYEYYRDDMKQSVNGSYRLSETVPAYLSGVVFQRHHLSSNNSYFGTIKFQVAFNLAVVWMIVFVSLSKGLRSYGKVVYVFTLLPIFGTFILCAKMLGMMPAESINVIFPETSWNEFFLNTQSWISACQETFLTWGFMGAAAMQIASHNKNKQQLQRDSRIICVITLIILLLVAFLANTCIEILKHNGYNYVPDSFERINTYVFLRPLKEPLPPSLAATPFRFMTHTSFILGERVTRPGIDPSSESGYQVLRLATEIVPATLAILGSDQVSPFWAVLFYFILILFGIAQQLAIWHCVITGIMAIKAKVLKSWETTITFFSCAAGFVLGLPMTTEMGIYVVFFLDCTVGGVWWLILVVLIQVMAVFMVRGRPYSGDTVVTALFPTNSPRPCYISWAPHMLSFIWNVILPVVLMVFCVIFFKNGNFKELFIWHHAPGADYWPLWARQIGALLQLLPILCIPLIAIVQSYRYLNNGPNDIFERIQLLYRPPLNSEHMEDMTAVQQAAVAAISNGGAATTTVAEDPPPKYTPPPSYTTATGARLAKLFRQSFRRSVRRIAQALGEGSSSRQRTTPPPGETGMAQQPPPPDYAAVLVEMSQPNISISITNELDTSTLTLPDPGEQRMSTIERRASRGTLTAADVASILRASFRRSTIRTVRRSANLASTVDSGGGSLSAECLVDGAEPIGESSIVVLGDLSSIDSVIKITD